MQMIIAHQPLCGLEKTAGHVPGQDDAVIVADEPIAVDDPRGLSPTARLGPLSMAMAQSPVKQPKKTSLLHSLKLPIPSLFTALPQPAHPPSRARSSSLGHSHAVPAPLSDFPAPPLLDDDPFANLTSCTPQPSDFPLPSEFPDPSQVPRPSTSIGSFRAHAAQATVIRPRSSGHGQVRPAYTKPAFMPRPSLPSLDTLAQMNMSLPTRKVRKGTPGARLPHEPWDINLSAELDLLTRSRQSSTSSPDNQSPAPQQETAAQTEHTSRLSTGDPELCLVSQESALDTPSLADETSSTRSLFGDDADMDSLPSLSYTVSEHSSSTLSRSSSIASSVQREHSLDVNSSSHTHDDQPSMSLHVDDDITEEDDPLSYHSDFDYYTQSLSDLSDSEPDLDHATGGKKRDHSPPIDVGITPYSSVYDPVVDFEPSSSANTMRRVSVLRESSRIDTCAVGSPNLDPPQEGGGWRGQPSEPKGQSGREDEGRGREASRRNGDHSGGQSSGAQGYGAGGDDNNGDKARRGKPRSSASSTSDFTSSSDDDADGITIYYSLDGMSNDSPPRAQSRTRSRYSKADPGSDDDIPLAQRVPTALSAQKSIRRQLHDERRQRKLERAKSSRTAADAHLPVYPPESLHAPAAPTSSRKRSVSAAPAPKLGLRVPTEPFPIEDLTRKLANLQNSSRTPASTVPPTYDSSIHSNPTPRAPGFTSVLSRSPSRGRHTDQTAHLQRKTSSRVPEPPSQDRPLRPMRSFHRPNGRHSETQSSPLEHGPNARLGRSATSGASGRAARTGHDVSHAGQEQFIKSGRPSEDSRRPSVNVPRSSTERESDNTQRMVQRPPVPPLPISDSTSPQLISRVPVVQQRIFIGDMQRFNLVEITPATNAGDVIDTVAGQGMLDRSGSWMLFEMAQDYGMERPVREYELLSDVTASWNKDKLLNAFVIKQTPLAQPLSRSGIPTSSPMHRGWVEWESKRGKWSKRWMELREHGLWLSKRDTGKDEVFLCSLSNFDAYCVTRRHKSPKPFVFSVKSTDHPSLFENVADYLHVFCCNPKDGENWMQAILIARSYVLYQERNVLFAKPGESLSQAKPLARSRTRKQSVSGRPAQPLVNVPPPFSQSTTANVAFEPGSLLAKRKGDAPP